MSFQLRSWAHAGLPAFAELFLPWQNKLTSLSLVSDWFQPGLNTAASIVGPLFCFGTYAVLKRSTIKEQRRVVLWSAPVFLSMLFVSIALKLTIGSLIFPETHWQHIVWLLQEMVYLLVFIFLAISMVAMSVLAPAR